MTGWCRRLAPGLPGPLDEALPLTPRDARRWAWIHTWMIAALVPTPAELVGLTLVLSYEHAGGSPDPAREADDLATRRHSPVCAAPQGRATITRKLGDDLLGREAR